MQAQFGQCFAGTEFEIVDDVVAFLCRRRVGGLRAACHENKGGKRQISDHRRLRRNEARDCVSAPAMPSTEGEGIGLHAGIKEFDGEGVVCDRSALANELVEPLRGDSPLTRGVRVHTVRGAGRLAVQRHAETHRGLCHPRVRARNADRGRGNGR